MINAIKLEYSVQIFHQFETLPTGIEFERIFPVALDTVSGVCAIEKILQISDVHIEYRKACILWEANMFNYLTRVKI